MLANSFCTQALRSCRGHARAALLPRPGRHWRRCGLAAAFALTAAFSGRPAAQEYPSKPVRLVVAAGPGGSTDDPANGWEIHPIVDGCKPPPIIL